MKHRTLGIIGAAGLLAAVVVTPVAAQDKVLKLGVTLPLSGGAAADGVPTLKGAQLAAEQANAAGGIGGYTIEVLPFDHAVAGKYNEQQAVQDFTALVADPAVIGVMGPYNSAVARVQIPIGNKAGLLQCSPANTNMTLTYGADEPVKEFPDKTAYIRVAATDDVQGPAMADYAYNTLGLRNIASINDVTTFGAGVAGTFMEAFKALGGNIAADIGAQPGTQDFNGIITGLPGDIDGVYYGGVVTSGAGLLLKQMRQQGVVVPFLGPDGIVNGAGDADGSLIQVAGVDNVTDTYGTTATIGDFEALGLGPRREEFVAAFEELFKDDADFNQPGAYSAAAYACSQIILSALGAYLEANPDADLAAIREGVRAGATDPATTFDTVIGDVAFTADGDIATPVITWWKVDQAAKDNIGDWAFLQQEVFQR